MKVSLINLQKIEQEGMRLLGVASVVINDNLCVYDIKIVQGTDKLFIAMPSKKVNDVFKDVAHPTNNEAKNAIEEVVLKAYNGQEYQEGNLEELKVTDIRIKKVEGNPRIVAVSSVVFNNQFVVNDIVLVKNNGMYTICLPSRKNQDGTFKNICVLKDKELLYSIEKSIVDAYTKM